MYSHHRAFHVAVLKCLLHTNGGRNADGGDEVVSAGVSQAREGVELGVERHGAPWAVGELGPECGGQVVGAAGDVESLLLEVVCEDLVRVDFLVPDLRVFPDLDDDDVRKDRSISLFSRLLLDGETLPLC